MLLQILSPGRGSFTEKQKEVGLMAKAQPAAPSRWHAAPDQLQRVLSLVELEMSKKMWWNLVVDGGEDIRDKGHKCVGKQASLVLLFPSLFLKFLEGILNVKMSKKKI